MRGIRISDQSFEEEGVLAFDLDDLLTVLRSTVDGLRWAVSDLCVVGSWGDWASEVADAATFGVVELTTVELRRFSESIGQTIWGSFLGSDANGAVRVRLEAVDSKYWDVWTDDEAVVRRLEMGFDEIEPLGDPPEGSAEFRR